MTPAKALKQLATPTPKCEPCDGAQDFCEAAGMSAYNCILTKTCPVCGSKGERSKQQNHKAVLVFFHCDRHTGHIFEVDDDSAIADRVHI